MNKLFLFVVSLTLCASLFAQQPRYSKVKILMNGKELKDIAKLGLSVENGSYKKGVYFITEYNQKDIKKLKNNGYQLEILIEDMTKFYQERNKKTKQDKKIKSSLNFPTPSHFKFGSMGGYLTYNEILQELDSMRILFPELVSVKQMIGPQTSIEGRSIYYIKISDNPDVDEDEPEVLYSALTHAREPAGMQQMIYYMYYILENYGIDDEVTALVNNLEMYFVPCVNPDGYEYNHATDPTGGGMWRKNRRNNGSGSFGVDLNRNYGMYWGYDNSGSSSNPSDDTYRGTAGFSEPETAMMKYFCEHRSFKLTIDYHCYGNMLLFPWGYTDMETPDSALYRKYANIMTQSNGFIWGNPASTVEYNANGGSFDWFYGEQVTKPKIIAFSPEAGNGEDGFWPAEERIEDICRNYMDMNLYLSRFALKYAVVSEISSEFIPEQNGFLKLKLQCLGMDVPADFTVSISPISPEISVPVNSISFTGMQTLEEKIDSLGFSINSSAQAGQILKFLVTVDNGMFQHSDTVSKIFGQPQIAFIDSCSLISNWTSSGWNTTSSTYHSAPKCITDSPNGDYNISPVNSSITLSQAINLSGVNHAYLSFWAKWDINAVQDYVQLKISTNNGTSWIPLSTTNTQPSIVTNIAGQPVFTGYNGQWHQETADLSSYVGQNVKFMFTLKSGWNYMYSYDGFYFDDFMVSKLYPVISGMQYVSENLSNEMAYPNPAGTYVIIPVPKNISFPCKLILFNSSGQIVSDNSITNSDKRFFLPLMNYQNGVYTYQFTDKYKHTEPGKLIILK